MNLLGKRFTTFMIGASCALAALSLVLAVLHIQAGEPFALNAIAFVLNIAVGAWNIALRRQAVQIERRRQAFRMGRP